ncbi:transcriptional regulator (plasmid) [Burkholderia sp. THE68]|uniref:helix-turn-helix domain-containing protein n=1 Tax=Burkholderia sp. THE68 TaxID=758782 RepID=UPI0013194B34|nr:helix-turn-helix transcriptional regulator [Burkholderia sp. THE68]BBU32612.1 transcriptional regulator [Burkholderia sp. THE68]
MLSSDMDETTTTPRQRAARSRLATNLKLLRGRSGVSQEDLSRRAGVSRAYVGQIERQRVSATLDIVASLAEALGVDEVELLCEPREAPIPLKKGRKKKSDAGQSEAK